MPSSKTVAIRELSKLKSEKTILVAIGIQLVIALFSSVVVIGLVTIFDPSAAGSQASVNFGVTGSESGELVDIIETTQGVSAQEYTDFSTAYVEFQEGNVDAVIQLEEGESGRIDAEIYAPETGIQNTVISVRGQEVLVELQEDKRIEFSDRLDHQPVTIQGNSDSIPFFTFTYTVLLPILVLLPAFIGGSLSSDSITESISKGTLEMLQVTPMTDGEIFDGKVLPMILFVPIQVFTWMVLFILRDITVENVLWLVMFGTGVAFIAGTIGVLSSLFFTDRSRAQFLYSSLIVVFFTFATAFPIDPINLIARLAIDSASIGVYATTVGYLVLGVAMYIGVRIYVNRNGFPNDVGNE